MIYIQCQQNDSRTETPAIQRSSSAPKALSPTVIRIFRKHVNFNQTGAGIFATAKMKCKQAVNDRKICVQRGAQKRARKDSFCVLSSNMIKVELSVEAEALKQFESPFEV